MAADEDDFKTPKPNDKGSTWSEHKRGYIMSMGMSGMILISIIVWIFIKP